jgi:Cyclopropane fatty acid synthase and related methyltransferases
MNLIDLCERGWIPDSLTRFGMRRLIAQRLTSESARDGEVRSARFNAFLDELRDSPIAIATDAANSQHYEVPSAFFETHLGPHMKYSCCLYSEGDRPLVDAEAAMLDLYAQRAGLADGQRILDLGCGWGSFALWAAARFPGAEVVGLSNSHGQRRWIEARAAERGIGNLRVVTGNVVHFDWPTGEAPFDRIVSIEMFEHMKNYRALLAKLARWLRPDGALFIHVFAHRELAYPFEDRDSTDWMTRYFFTGGTMPNEQLFAHFQDDLRLERHWWLSGRHYQRTAEAWLAGLDAARSRALPILREGYGDEAEIWFQRWRMFYMAVAELFGFRGGEEWGVAHYRFVRRGNAAADLGSD